LVHHAEATQNLDLKMKNIQQTAPETDRKIQFAASVFLVMTFLALVGYLLPTPLEETKGRLLGAGISLLAGFMAWNVFQLLQPAKHTHTWKVKKAIGIPMIWLLILLALTLWGFHSNAVFMKQLGKVKTLSKDLSPFCTTTNP
jgi:hypothetical protein